jgi:hypothetical protein
MSPLDDFLRRVIARREREQRQAELEAEKDWRSPEAIEERKRIARKALEKRGFGWTLPEESDE